MQLSVSAVNEGNICTQAYINKYVHNIELKTEGLSPRVLGSVVHYALEQTFLGRYKGASITCLFSLVPLYVKNWIDTHAPELPEDWTEEHDEFFRNAVELVERTLDWVNLDNWEVVTLYDVLL